MQIQVELPFGNRTARANVARAEIAVEQIARQRQRLEQAIQVEVRNTLQSVRSSEARPDAASSAQRNASEQYESERRRFEAGLSTVFLLHWGDPSGDAAFRAIHLVVGRRTDARADEHDGASHVRGLAQPFHRKTHRT